MSYLHSVISSSIQRPRYLHSSCTSSNFLPLSLSARPNFLSPFSLRNIHPLLKSAHVRCSRHGPLLQRLAFLALDLVHQPAHHVPEDDAAGGVEVGAVVAVQVVGVGVVGADGVQVVGAGAVKVDGEGRR